MTTVKVVTEDSLNIRVYCPPDHKISCEFLCNLQELVGYYDKFEHDRKTHWYKLPNTKAIVNIVGTLRKYDVEQENRKFNVTQEQYLKILDRLNKLEYKK